MNRDSTRYVARNRSLVFWILLITLSIFLILDVSDLNTGIFWIFTFGIFLSLLLAYRISRFREKTQDLLTKGKSLSAYSYKSQQRNFVYLLILTAVAFLAPFFLAGALGFQMWFGSLLGIVDGWIGQLLLYNLYLRSWERNHKGTLYRLETWSGPKVTQTGLEFSRENKT